MLLGDSMVILPVLVTMERQAAGSEWGKGIDSIISRYSGRAMCVSESPTRGWAGGQVVLCREMSSSQSVECERVRSNIRGRSEHKRDR